MAWQIFVLLLGKGKDGCGALSCRDAFVASCEGLKKGCVKPVGESACGGGGGGNEKDSEVDPAM